MPWSNSSKTLSTNTTTITTTRAIHKKSQQTHTQPKTPTKPKNTRSPSQIQPNPQDIQAIDDDDPSIFSTSITSEIIQQSTLQPISQRKTRSAAQTNKKIKLPDLASNALVSENDTDYNDDLPTPSTSIIPEQPTPQPISQSTIRKTRSAVRTNKKTKLANLASNALASKNDNN